jgi:hypothetical protein
MVGANVYLVESHAGIGRRKDDAFSPSAAATNPVPASSLPVGGVPMAALMTSAETGTAHKNRVPLGAPRCSTPKLNAITEQTVGTAAT